MKPFITIFLITLSASFISCTNITLLGHVVAYDANVELKGDPVVPVGMNVGFESRSFVAVPPKNSVNWKKNLLTDKSNKQDEPYSLPKGDVLSTISKLKIEGFKTPDAVGGVAFDFVSSGATGDAAIAAAGGNPPAATGTQSTDLKASEKAQKIANELENISNSSNSIPKR